MKPERKMRESSTSRFPKKVSENHRQKPISRFPRRLFSETFHLFRKTQFLAPKIFRLFMKKSHNCFCPLRMPVLSAFHLFPTRFLYLRIWGSLRKILVSYQVFHSNRTEAFSFPRRKDFFVQKFLGFNASSFATSREQALSGSWKFKMSHR